MGADRRTAEARGSRGPDPGPGRAALRCPRKRLSHRLRFELHPPGHTCRAGSTTLPGCGKYSPLPGDKLCFRRAEFRPALGDEFGLVPHIGTRPPYQGPALAELSRTTGEETKSSRFIKWELDAAESSRLHTWSLEGGEI